MEGSNWFATPKQNEMQDDLTEQIKTFIVENYGKIWLSIEWDAEDVIEVIAKFTIQNK